MSRRDRGIKVQKLETMQKEGGKQVYENYIRKENPVTLESRRAPWISAHCRKPEVGEKEMVVNCKNELKSSYDSDVSCC